MFVLSPRIQRAAVLLSAATLALPAAPAGATVSEPAADPFYSYAGSLGAVPNGAILKTRTVTVQAARTLPVVSATQVLYRSSDDLGAPDATVATVIRPAVQVSLPGVAPKIVSYQLAYDGLNGTCRPSYTLQTSSTTVSATLLDQTTMLDWVAQGYTVVTADYEGSTDNFGAGTQSGRQTLDAIRATETLLGAPSSTTTALEGYSGGSIATEWAAELQPTYAPELNIVGAAAGGVPVDFAHNVAYVNGSAGWAGAIPAVGLGLFRAFHLDPDQYLNALGQQTFAAQAAGCLNPAGNPGLTFESLLKPQYQNWRQVPELVKVFNSTIMGRTNTPAVPMLLAVGNADGIGDNVMIAGDVQQLAYQYCQRGANLDFSLYNKLNHGEGFAAFIPQAATFLTQRLNGLPITSNCPSVTPGNSLDPIPMPN